MVTRLVLTFTFRVTIRLSMVRNINTDLPVSLMFCARRRMTNDKSPFCRRTWQSRNSRLMLLKTTSSTCSASRHVLDRRALAPMTFPLSSLRIFSITTSVNPFVKKVNATVLGSRHVEPLSVTMTSTTHFRSGTLTLAWMFDCKGVTGGSSPVRVKWLTMLSTTVVLIVGNMLRITRLIAPANGRINFRWNCNAVIQQIRNVLRIVFWPFFQLLVTVILNCI